MERRNRERFDRSPCFKNMKLTYIIAAIVLVCAAALMIFFYTRQKKPVKAALFGSLSGLLSLLVARFAFSLAGLLLPLNVFSVCLAVILGLPGTIVLCLLQLL